ncbi:MAG: hypothetical protein LBV12_04670, partial [Puniceicoccales bacterium]|nr:hypothetical protein [Puniceicoccales bacterium]
MNQEKQVTYKVSPIWVIVLLVLIGMIGGGIYYFIETNDQNERDIKFLNSDNNKNKAEIAKLNASYS